MIWARRRRAIVEAPVAMSWADGRLGPDETAAVHAAGEVLELPDGVFEALGSGPPAIEHIAHDDLGESERRLVYLCAAWAPSIDSRDEEGETGLLTELREALAIDAVLARALRDDACMLHVTVPTRMRFRERLETLISRASEAV